MYLCLELYIHQIHFLYKIFFFQAEDGIRDGHVTGVQTCALPISWQWRCCSGSSPHWPPPGSPSSAGGRSSRSEERRVGKECRFRGLQNHQKKILYKK